MSKPTAVSGMRPTDRLHLGNWLGALQKWLALQETHRCFFMIADWHAITTEYADPKALKDNVQQVALDYLAAGLDPERCTVFVQSQVPQHAELFLMLSMIVPVPWLERNPTYKEQMQEIKGKDLTTFGFLGYPVLQAADILLYKADVVPVGMDQLPHLEICREIARRFNSMYSHVFSEPKAELTQVPKLPGTDGRKMSKSYGNAIYLSDAPEVLRKKVMSTLTDPARVRREDKGHPEVCPVYALQQIFNAQQKDRLAEECRSAAIGCVDCKALLHDGLSKALAPMAEKRKALQSKPGMVQAILAEGARKAAVAAAATMAEVRDAVGLMK